MITVIYQLVVPFPPKLLEYFGQPDSESYSIQNQYYAEFDTIAEPALHTDIGTKDDDSADVLTFSTEAEAVAAEAALEALNAKYLALAG